MATLLSQSSFTDLTLPNGTTGQRPGSPTIGMVRYNTDVNLVEFYDGSNWRPVTGYSAGTIGTGGDSVTVAPGAHGGIIHRFTSTGAATFTPTFTGYVQVLTVGGGGGGGHSSWGGGGGGGGMIFSRAYPVSAGVGIPVSVGGGSTGQGGGSSFGSQSVSGGGHSNYWDNTVAPSGCNGGSGGGGGNSSADSSRQRSMAGLGTTGQGFPGGSGVRFNDDGENTHNGGGGGGAGGPGLASQDSNQRQGTHGGPGAASDILGDVYYWAGGGASGPHICDGGGGDGGVGGGGGGAAHYYPGLPLTHATGYGGGQSINQGSPGTNNGNHGSGGGAGAANTGGGGGAGGGGGLTGGSGIVVVRY